MKQSAAIILTMLFAYLPVLNAQEVKQEWSQFLGPNFDCSYQMPEGVKPAISEKDMRHRWDSEAMVGATGLSRQQMPSGGAATPIVYQDKIYLWYFTPNLTEGIFDTTPPTRKVPNEFGSWSFLYRVLDNAVSADQQIVCMDANTGKTIWQRSFPATGLVQNGHKDGLNNMTMAAGDGKVYAFGSGRYIYCLDADSGALIWRMRHINYVGFQTQRVQQQASGEQFKRSRDGNNYLTLVDVVLVAGGNDNGTGMAGYDAKTGQRLWSTHGWIGARASAKVWMHQGKGYVVAAGFGKVGLIDPKTGEFLWQLTEGMAAPGAGFSIQGDYLFTNRGEPKGSEVSNGRLACYKLNLKAPVLMWEADEADGFPTAKNQGIFVHDGKAFMRSMNYVQVYDVKDGKKLKSILLVKGASAKSDDTAIIFRINNLLYQVIDSQHLHYPTVVIDMDMQKIVGRFTILHPGISYSSHMLPVFHGEHMILRRGYCRISSFLFIQQEEKSLEVKINEPIQVATKNEAVQFTATVKGDVKAVRFLLDGKAIARDTAAPFTATIKRDALGVHQVQAIAEGVNGEEAKSYKKLLKVLDWEVIMLPKHVTMEAGERRRFIPLAVDSATGDLLPQKYQSVRMSQNLDNTWPDAFKGPSAALEKEWKDRVKFEASSGTVDVSIGASNKSPYPAWGAYKANQPGQHTISAHMTINGVTRSAQSKIHVRKDGERLPLSIKHIAPFQTFVIGKSGSVRPVAGTDAGKKSWVAQKDIGIQIKVHDGEIETRKGKFPLTKPGFVTFKYTHPGTDKYLPAEPVFSRALIINKGRERNAMAIDFPEIADQKSTTDSFSFSATSPSEEPVKISVISGPATITQEGNQATISLSGKPGIVTVIAEHGGDLKHKPALPVVREFYVK